MLVKRLQAELILILKGFVQLEIEVRQPALAEFRLSLLGDRLVDNSHLAEVVTPDNLVPKEVNVHEFDYHINQGDVDLPQLSVFINQLSGASLYFFDVSLDFVRVVPGNNTVRSLTLAFGVLDDVLKLLSLVNHHGHLALNDLGAHGVVEVGHLFKGHTLFVELFGVGSHSADLSRDVEPMLS